MNESHLNEWIMIVITIYKEFDLDSFISCLIDVDLVDCHNGYNYAFRLNATIKLCHIRTWSDSIVSWIKKNRDQMEAFKSLVTIERTIELRFKVDTRLRLFPLLNLFGSVSFRLIDSRYCNWRTLIHLSRSPIWIMIINKRKIPIYKSHRKYLLWIYKD